ncbi:MAG: type II toxin-antitoxin system HipA family toxin [Betaproteobacteria bacterium]|nr:MAG: type II toxin-antitoxin system HipA family toxin [Betaproteobacteria bacterium]
MDIKPVTAVEVMLWGQRVGALAFDPRVNFYVFEYEPAFVKSGIEIAPLTMPLTHAGEPFVFTNLPAATFKRLPAAIADALPDDFGNALIDAWMMGKGFNREAIGSLDRLAYMGKRGMGALEFRPMRGPHVASHTAIRLNRLVEGARHAVRGDFDTDAHSKAALAQIMQVGTSAGGARAKAVIAWNPDTHEIHAGQFDVAPGFEHWLLKFDGIGPDTELGGGADYGRIEYAYHLMAVAAGIQMSPCRLLEEGGRAHFMTRRFDRAITAEGQTVKYHLQSLCAMSHLDYKQRATHTYAQLFMTIAQLKLSEDTKVQAFRRMVFNIMARNCDDHTKNFAFRLKPGEAWELAPAYDITHAYNPQGEWTYQHLMSVNGRFKHINRDDLLRVADRFSVGPAHKVIDQVTHALADWPQFAREAGLHQTRAEQLRADFQLMH